MGLRLPVSSEALMMAVPGKSSVPALRTGSAHEGKGRDQGDWLASPSALLIPGWRAKKLTLPPDPRVGGGGGIFVSQLGRHILAQQVLEG